MIIWSVCDSSFGVFAAFAGFRAGDYPSKPFPARTALCRGSLAASAESFEPIFAEGAVQWVRTHEMVAQGDGHTVRSVQSPGRTFDREHAADESRDLLLGAEPRPVIHCLMRVGAYSNTCSPRLNAAAIATPCARPSLSIDCTFSPKKGDSRATSRGRYSSTRAPTRSKM